MTDNLFLALIVISIAGFIFWSIKREKAEPLQVLASSDEVAVAEGASTVETGVSMYLRNLPPPPVLTGVTKYLKSLPKPAVETSVAKYLKNLQASANAETVVAQHGTSNPARAPEISLEKLLESIPAPNRETGVTRYVKTIGSP